MQSSTSEFEQRLKVLDQLGSDVTPHHHDDPTTTGRIWSHR